MKKEVWAGILIASLALIGYEAPEILPAVIFVLIIAAAVVLVKLVRLARAINRADPRRYRTPRF